MFLNFKLENTVGRKNTTLRPEPFRHWWGLPYFGVYKIPFIYRDPFKKSINIDETEV